GRTLPTELIAHRAGPHAYFESSKDLLNSALEKSIKEVLAPVSRYHFIKEQFEKGIVELLFVETEYQLADLFTKALSEDKFKYLVRRLGMRCLTPEELEVLANEFA
ncbi:hypothetical protein Tco_0999220, partial [Tanacetum coccineum]